MSRFSWLIAVLMVTILSPLLAQAQPTPEPDAAADAITAAAERQRPNRIAWQPCPENASVECGTLTLPVDYRKPRGETFEMAVIRAKAFDPSRRIGTIVLNNGGPAASGVDFVLAGVGVPAFDGLRTAFDVVSFDVRGSHRSRPVRCEVAPAGDPGDVSDEQLASFIDDFSRRFAQTCVEQNGPFILSMSTNNIARDMDMLRRALGDAQITYVGQSYGTVLGGVYATLFPKRVRAMILDAGIQPEFRDSLVEFAAEQTISFEQTFHRLDQLCRKDAACPLRDGGVVAAMDAVLARLTDAPVTSPNGTVLAANDVQGIVASLLQFESAWPLIVQALAEARDDNYTRLFQLIPAISTIPLSNTAFFAIKCNDSGTRRSAAEYLPVSESVGALTPRLNDRFQVAAILSTCAAWPAADVPIIRNIQRRVANPILMIGNDFDPNTPLSWTRSLAFALGTERSLVRYQGGGHTIVTRATACVGATVGAYLFSLVVPAEGTVCPARPIAFAPQSSSMQNLDAQHNLWSGPPLPLR